MCNPIAASSFDVAESRGVERVDFEVPYKADV
jgi:hypothetical protein